MPYKTISESSKYIQFDRYCFGLGLAIASSILCFGIPKVGILFLLFDFCELLKSSSKLSSWLPAITILCLWGNLPVRKKKYKSKKFVPCI